LVSFFLISSFDFLHFLSVWQVSENEGTNKMGMTNLAIVFAPGMLRSENEMNALKDFRYQSKIMEELIKNQETLFP